APARRRPAGGKRQPRPHRHRDGQGRRDQGRSRAPPGGRRRTRGTGAGRISEDSMDKFVITGGAALRGEIATSGSKNSALPALAAALLTDEPVGLDRVRRLRDIRTMERLLVDIGTTVDVEG